jgi:hypothetical protein
MFEAGTCGCGQNILALPVERIIPEPQRDETGTIVGFHVECFCHSHRLLTLSRWHPPDSFLGLDEPRPRRDVEEVSYSVSYQDKEAT